MLRPYKVMGVPQFFAWLMRNYKQKNFIFSKETTNDEIVKKLVRGGL